jgi:hypothetical protein
MNLLIANPQPVHTHIFAGATDDLAGHKHSFSGFTGAALQLPECSGLEHIHEIYVTHCSFLYMHNHVMRGITGPAIWISETEHYHVCSGLTVPCPADEHCHDFSGATKAV